MATEYMVLNPRRKRRRKRRVHASRPVRRRRRVHRALANPNPRRRRRSYRRRARALRRRHARSNPRKFAFAGIDVGAMGLGAAGFLGVKVGAGWINQMLAKQMPDIGTNPLAVIGVKAAVGIGGPMLLRQFKVLPREATNIIAVGAGIAIAVDLFNTYLAPALGLSDYELTGFPLGEYLPSDTSGGPLGDAYANDLLPEGGDGIGAMPYSGSIYG